MAQKNAVKLTQKIVQTIQYEGKTRLDAKGKLIAPRFVRWDSEVKGLGLRVYPSGKKAWVLSYYVEGRKRMMQLGVLPSLTLDKARKAALSHKGKMAAAEAMNTTPVDPIAERQEARRGDSVADLCSAFLDRHASKRKTAGEYKRRFEKYILPAWGKMKVKDVKRPDVAALHNIIGKDAPYEANRVLALVSVLFEKGNEWGFLPDEHINPALRIKKFQEKKRDRWVTHEEMPRLADAIEGEADIYVRSALWLLLLTGARKSELLGLKWSDIDLARKEIRLADTKAGRIHHIPLSEESLEVINNIPPVKDNPYLLPGRIEGQHLVNIDKPWRRVRAIAGLEDVRLHDLRRTVGSWLATEGASLPLIGKVLNHSNVSTTAIYARLSEDPARKALDSHGAKIMSIIAGRKS